MIKELAKPAECMFYMFALCLGGVLQGHLQRSSRKCRKIFTHELHYGVGGVDGTDSSVILVRPSFDKSALFQPVDNAAHGGVS